MIVKKVLWVFATVLAFSTAAVILDGDAEDSSSDLVEEEFFKIEPHIFESRIMEALIKFRDFLKKGDPENGVAPLDPAFVPFQAFDFVINDTALEGYFQDVTIANFSGFEPLKIEFKLLPLHFKIDVLLQNLWIGGRYKLVGKILNEIPVNGSGKFTSETGNLTLSLYLKPTKVGPALQIKDIIFEFKTLSEKIKYTNELEGDGVQTLNESLALYVLDQVQAKYVPPLLNTGKLVLNHFLLGYTFQDIMKLILDFLNKN